MTDPAAPPATARAAASPAAARPPLPLRGLHRLEDGVSVLALAVMVVLPLAEIVARTVFQTGVPGSAPFTRHLTLWVAFLGAAMAAREGKLLALATGTFLPERWRGAAEGFAALVGAGVSALLARASAELVWIEYQSGTTVAAGVPAWVAQLPLPISFALIALRLVWRASARWPGRAMAAVGLAAGIALGQWPGLLEGRPAWPGLVVIVAATLVGSPIFAVLGGAAALLFMADGVPLAAVPAETYRLAVSPLLAAIPLFTLTGFLLAEGKASLRLLALFRALFGWVPGGTAVVCALICAFFTVFTGGSGVTILALGGLLFQALRAEGYRESFSLGLLTASGSLGLLLPPALPLILYGIVAGISIEDLFLGGLLPGILLVALVAGWGVREGIVGGAERHPFSAREAGRALWLAKWELLLPVVVLVSIFAGWATLVETSAIAALYALVSQVAHRDIRGPRQLFGVFRDCVVLLGGVLIILGVAMGLTSWLVDAQVPAQVLEWVQQYVQSPLAFLLLLNVFLLLVGCLMDIFSAIVVVVPLIAPLGEAYGIHPVHLGIVFIANLELGYLTPPVGLNLFLASYRFERPLLEIYRAAVPYLVLRGLGVLLVTYVPFLTTWILGGP
ncbi:MAG TPA: TRAP transporter large permease subunit [Thermoanaerobaculia bacterium]|nr:TRAP transporter large permease subunit [Thermoanaerobaculia bacterium]